MTLHGKHALVSGGGTGIGLGIAQALAAEGAAVTITGRRASALEHAASETPGLFPLVMDVTDETSVVEGFAQAVTERGPIRIHVANAGIAEGRSLPKTDMAFWRQIMATNIDGAFLTIREALKSMTPAGWGRVIAVSSIAGIRGLKGAPAYTASKHAMTGLIRSLAADYLGREITFNALCPGYVDTAIVERNIVSIRDRAGVTEDQAKDIMVSANPHKRLIDVAEVAAAAVWLCDERSGSVNGQTIAIAGGEI